MRHVSETAKESGSAQGAHRARSRRHPAQAADVAAASVPAQANSVEPSHSGNARQDVAAQQRHLREQVIEFRRERARIDEENDFLLRHIGLRTLSTHTDERGLNPDCLEQAEDQAFVRLLLNTLKKDVLRSLSQLNEDERVDLDTLDDCANSAQQFEAAQDDVRNAEQWVAGAETEWQRVRAEYEAAVAQSRKIFEGLRNAVERPVAIRRMGALLGVFGVCALAWLLMRGGTSQRWAETLTLGLGVVSLAALGFYLSRSVVARRHEMKVKLELLSKRLEEAAGISATARATREAAVRRCQQAEADFRRDEAAAVDVAHRRPRVVHYVTQTMKDTGQTATQREAVSAPTS